MPDGNRVNRDDAGGGGDGERIDLSRVEPVEGEPERKRGFFNTVRDGWQHVGGGRWRNLETGETERRPGKGKAGRRAGKRGPAAVDVGGAGAERRETGPRGSKASLALGSIERLLISIHYGVGIALRAPELELSEQEAEAYAKSVATVARHYDMGASAKTLDWFNLLTTMGSIYGVRLMQIAARRKDERSGQRRPAPNGHDPSPPQEGGDGIDWSLMAGRMQ